MQLSETTVMEEIKEINQTNIVNILRCLAEK